MIVQRGVSRCFAEGSCRTCSLHCESKASRSRSDERCQFVEILNVHHMRLIPNS